MEIPYEQLSQEEALKTYCDWLLSQQTDEPFFRVFELGQPIHEWYMVFYPVRTLLLGGKLLKDDSYIQTAIKYVDTYLTEQLPNGAFTSNYRKTPTGQLNKKDFHDILRYGKVNLADNGSNLTAIVQATAFVEGEKRGKYIKAARRWFDEWIPIWALPDGGYNNGLWCGEVHSGPYTCAISTVAAALSAFGKLTGEYEYIQNAERCISFQCSAWTDDEDGRPINFDGYKHSDRSIVLNDFGHSFYLLEGMCWTHSASNDTKVRELIEKRLKAWIFGKKGLLSQWGDSWFNYMITAHPWDEEPGALPTSRQSSIRLGWEMAKSNGIIHAFIYYLNNIEDNPILRTKVELALKYLTHPLKCRMSGVMSDPEESYGAFAVQSTGFAGLSLAEAIQKNSVFSIEQLI